MLGLSILLTLVVALVPSAAGAHLVVAGYLGLFILALVNGATFFVPGTITVAVFLAGRSFNPVGACALAAAGSALGETVSYLAGYATRGLLSPAHNVSPWRDRVAHVAGRFTFLAIVLIAAVPNPFVDFIGIVAGRARYPYPKFFTAQLLGKAVQFGVAAFLGAWLFRTTR